MRIVVHGQQAFGKAVLEKLLERGFLVIAIRPPTVPANTARLRVTLSAAHTLEQIDCLTEQLSELLKSLR